MAKCKILMQTAQVQKMIDKFDGYSDDKIVSCKFIKIVYCYRKRKYFF